MNSKMLMSRDKASLLASRDKHSVVKSFEATFKDDIKFSKQRVSRVKSDLTEKDENAAVPVDAEKLAKDAGGEFGKKLMS